MQNRPYFLVLEPDSLVAEDIVELIHEASVDAETILASTVAEALLHVNSGRGIAYAILDERTSEIRERNIAEDILAGGGKVIVLHDNGYSDEDAILGRKIFVRRPFTTSMMEDALKEIRG